MSWKRIEKPPDWLVDAAKEDRAKAAEGAFEEPLIGNSRTYEGDTYVYKVDFTRQNHGHQFRYHRQLKSEYFETTRDEGTCPNCQSYIDRYDGDDYLTCHRCGWQYKPLTERIRNIL